MRRCDSFLEALDRLAPRRLLVPASPKSVRLDKWFEAPFLVSDVEFARAFPDSVPSPFVEWDGAITGAITNPTAMTRLLQTDMGREAARALQNAALDGMLPGTVQPIRLSVRREYNQMVFTADCRGANRKNPQYVYGEPRPEMCDMLVRV